ncbi:MAG: hypothetical protein K9J12_03575, partial [Melioribacteraceae bacterium]|nr:hypothetical protein [Melioribacteraceae bacterium]
MIMKSYKTEKQITPMRQNTNNRKQISLFPRYPISILRFPFTLILSSFFLLSPACRQAWFIFLLVSCGANDPIIEDNTKPGRRDYEWTLDTLYSPNNWLSSIWGASPNSVWLAGAGGITNYDRLWYFNGETWAPYTQQ